MKDATLQNSEATGTQFAALDKVGFGQQFDVSKRTVDGWLADGLPHLKLSARCVRIPVAEASAWVRKNFSRNAAPRRPNNFRNQLPPKKCKHYVQQSRAAILPARNSPTARGIESSSTPQTVSTEPSRRRRKRRKSAKSFHIWPRCCDARSGLSQSTNKIMKHQIVPESAGENPATPENPAPWKPVIDFPSEREEIKMPAELTSNQSGGYPGGCPGNHQNQ